MNRVPEQGTGKLGRSAKKRRNPRMNLSRFPRTSEEANGERQIEAVAIPHTGARAQGKTVMDFCPSARAQGTTGEEDV